MLLINKKNNMSTFNENSYQRAKERVEAIKGFYGNLLAYIIVIPALFWLNYHSSNFNWAIFPAIGWGFGLLVNGLQAYNLNPFLGRDWEDRKIKELMKKTTYKIPIMELISNEEKYRKAKERVDELKKFYANLTSSFSNYWLAILNYWINEWRYAWFFGQLLVSIGLFFHALNTFRWNPFFGKDWEERKIKKLMEKKTQTKWK